MKELSRWCIYIGPEHLLHTETEANALVTEELIALAKADQIKRKNLEWERSGSDEGPDMRKIGKEEGHSIGIRKHEEDKMTSNNSLHNQSRVS